MSPRGAGTAVRLSRLAPTFTAKQARVQGIHWRHLYSLRDAGEIIELTRGVYRKASAPETAHVDLLAVAARAPLAVVCLESALALHELTDEVPREIRVAVPRGRHAPHFDYPPVSVSRFEPHTFDASLASRRTLCRPEARLSGQCRRRNTRSSLSGTSDGLGPDAGVTLVDGRRTRARDATDAVAEGRS